MSDDVVPPAILEAWSLLQDFLREAPEGSFLDELTTRLDDDLVNEVPELAGDAALRDDLDASTHALLGAFFRTIADDPMGAIDIPPAVLGLARTMAIRKHDVGPLLRAYRVGQRLAWRELIDIVGEQIEDAHLRLQTMTFLFDRLSRELERIVDASVAVFTEERDRWLTGAMARRSDTIQAILRGDAVDRDEATRVLGHRLSRHQLGLLLWLDDASTEVDPLRLLEATAQSAADALGSAPPLTLPEGARSLWAWLSVQHDTGLDRLDLALASAANGLHIAAGVAAYGVPGFRTSHQQALLARRVAQAADVPAAITRYADVQVVSAFLADPESMRELVARELGGLAVADETTSKLRETTLEVLRAGGSARDAAAALGVHKNTVLYRLRSIEEALGRPLDTRLLSLEIALQIVEQLGESVLPADSTNRFSRARSRA
jgi:DNA-binding PucR family transcriptional regulator